MKKRIPPLLIDHQDDLSNMYLFSIVEYNRSEHVCIIDNITSSELRAFVIDHEYEDAISKAKLVSEAVRWLYESSDKHQLSIQLAIRGYTNQIGPLYKRFDLGNVSRIVGKVFQYNDLAKSKVRRKRVITIPEGIEIHFKKISI